MNLVESQFSFSAVFNGVVITRTQLWWPRSVAA